MLTLQATATTGEAAPIDARWVASGLRTRVLVPLAVGLLLLVATLSTMILLSSARVSALEAEELASSVQARVIERTDSETRTMRSLLELLLRDEHLVAAMRAGDRDQLLSLAGPLFANLRERNKISHMSFIQPDRTAFLRAQAPRQFGDRIDRASLLNAQKTLAPAWENEPGALGTYTLRVVYPWVYQGALIGYVELGIELEDILSELKKTVGAEFFVTVDKSLLDRRRWDAAQAKRSAGLRASWDEFPRSVVITRTTGALPPLVRSLLKDPEAGSRWKLELTEGAQIVSIPFALGGRGVGQLLVMMDTTVDVIERRRAILALIAASILVGGSLTAFFYMRLGKVQDDVAERTKRLEEARAHLGEERHNRRRAEDELHSQQERNELLEARSRMVEELAAATETAHDALRINEEITAKLRQTQSELVATARQAGRAEIATNVLHNVGNVLNSVNTSAGLIGGTLRRSRLVGLTRALDMLEQHRSDVGTFLSHDEKGKLLPGYLAAAGKALAGEQEGMARELDRLIKSLDHIKDIVATQQSHAVAGHVIEPVKPADLAEDALRMQNTSLNRHNVEVVREFEALPLMPLDRGRVLQILVNLISNAKTAMAGLASGARRLTVRIDMPSPSRLRFAVSDIGEGIPAENLTRIFAHGFTTRADGHGFGLHSSALAARDLGGTLLAHSDGPGQGATFTLELPVPAGMD